MPSTLRLLSAILLVLPAASATAWSAQPLPTTQQIEDAARDLADDRFSVRERASLLLWEAGRSALRTLDRAAAGDDPEAASRAAQIRDAIALGLPSGTSPRHVAIARSFQSGDLAYKQRLVNPLTQEKPPAADLLVCLWIAEPDSSRVAVFRSAGDSAQYLTANASNEVDGPDPALTEAARQISLLSDSREGPGRYAATLAIRGRLQARAPWWESLSENRKSPPAWRIRTALARAEADFPTAIRSAQNAADDALLRCVLAEGGQWTRLAHAFDQTPGPSPVDRARAALCYRLAGDVDGANRAMQAMEAQRRQAALTTPAFEAWAYLLNDQPDAAIARLKIIDGPSAMSLLLARHQYADALRFSADRPDLALARASLLAKLGQIDQATAAFDALVAAGDKSVSRLTPIIAAQRDARLTDLAARHLALALDGAAGQNLRDLWAAMFGGRSVGVEVWWDIFRRLRPNEPTPATIERLRSLYERYDSDTLEADAADAAKLASTLNVEDRRRWLEHIAGACRVNGKTQLAQQYYAQLASQTGSSWGNVMQADLLLDEGRFAEAAALYEKAYGVSLQPYQLYLRGVALRGAGKTDEAGRYIERARLAGYGEAAEIRQIIDHLARHGLVRESDLEALLLARTSAPGSDTGITPARAMRWLASPDTRQAALGLITRVELQRPAPYPAGPDQIDLLARMHAARAAIRLADGDTAAAIASARLALAMRPGCPAAVEIVPALAAANLTREADALYAQATAIHEATVTQFPACADAHADLARVRLAAGRDLDNAAQSAARAAQLAPSDVAILQTLAQCQLASGRRPEALATIDRALRLARTDPDLLALRARAQ